MVGLGEEQCPESLIIIFLLPGKMGNLNLGAEGVGEKRQCLDKLLRGGEGSRGEWASCNYYYQFTRVCFIQGLFCLVCYFFFPLGNGGGGSEEG